MLKAMPIPVIGLVGQPSFEVTDISVGSSADNAGCNTMTASISGVLWRNPDDKADPVNLAELDESTRRAIEDVPPWPRPAWLIEQVERMRYPLVWEAIQTTWHRDESEHTTLDHLLVHHANYILMNQFREELGLGLHDWDSPALASKRVVRPGVELVIDGAAVVGAMIDTDPFVYAVGANLAGGGTLTAVIPRDHLPYLNLEFATRFSVD